MNHVQRPVLLIVLLMLSIQARAIERPNVVITRERHVNALEKVRQSVLSAKHITRT